MKKYGYCLLFLFSITTNVICQEKKIKKVKYPESFTAQLDAVYTSIDDWDGRMDLYYSPKSEKPTPIVIHMHGGGWARGTKESQGGFNFLFENGIAVANVEYRLRDVAKAPAAIEDVRCALIYILKNAKELNIDTSRIIFSGGSAGGHLALMGGLLGNNKLFDKNCDFKFNFKAAAIINRYGATDISRLMWKGSVRRWLDYKIDDTKFIASVSPLSYVSENSPPVFTIHGDKDEVIPLKQSLLLNRKLKKNKVKTKLMKVKGGGHGKFSKAIRKDYQDEVILFLQELNIID